MNRTRRQPLLSIPMTAALLFVLPSLAININYLIAASEGHVPWCNPYWDSCTSISATGRQGVAFFFFKGTMLPLAILYGYYWHQVSLRLRGYGDQRNTIRNLGYFAVAALVLYTIALGGPGEEFRLARQIGIIFYFTLTYLCQLLIVYKLGKLGKYEKSQRWQLRLSLFILFIGVITLILDVVLPNYDNYEDAFEWNIALLVHLNFLLAAWGWRNLSSIHTASDE